MSFLCLLNFILIGKDKQFEATFNSGVVGQEAPTKNQTTTKQTKHKQNKIPKTKTKAKTKNKKTRKTPNIHFSSYTFFF